MKQSVYNVAVIVSGIDEEYQNNILRGIQDFAKTHRVNVCHFVAFGGVLYNHRHDMGEYNIYNLVNYNQIDGVILLTNTICNTEMKEKILAQVYAAGIPAVSVDNDLEGLYHVGIDNYAAMKKMVDHMLSAHPVRYANYISGPDNNPESLARLKAFRDSMTEHGLPIEEERIYMGEFRGQDGRAAAEAFLASDLPFPDAIISANDAMAISALIALEAHNIFAPKDVIISGFDNVHTARNYSPELSSVARPLYESGYQSCQMLLNHLNGVPQERSVILETTQVYTESCGCKSAMSDSISAFKKANYRIVETHAIDIQRNNRMSCNLTECDSFEDNMERLKASVQEIHCESFYLCLCEDWRNDMKQTADGMNVLADSYTVEGYTKRMVVPVAYRDGKFVDHPGFASEIMLPNLKEEQENGKSYFFLPIHFRERCLGYCVICNSKFPMESANFSSWVMNISNSLENVRKIICMDAVVKELDKLYILDPLSGIYNRNGFTRNTKDLYLQCQNEKQPVMVMFLDLDGLKYINDTYGHKAGDKALRGIGQCLARICDQNEITARFGGDEFLVFATGYDDQMAKDLTVRLEKSFEAFNQTSGADFVLAASIGYHIAVPEPDLPLFSLITVADQKMYEEKKKKKMSKYLRK